MQKAPIVVVECPRDAMQGIHEFIPTLQKIAYLNALLQVGFNVLDFGSFVSPKAIPQMKDTKEVLEALEESPTELLAIIANERGAREAVSYSRISYLGFPLSVSETFQQRNTNMNITQALEVVKTIQELCVAANKRLVVYLSMGFGNPYGDPWNVEVVESFVFKLAPLEISIISLADTIGSADPQDIKMLFSRLIPQFPGIEFGAHFHAAPNAWRDKLEAAWEGGCRRFDGALKGFGGCPYAKDELVGNIATENILHFIETKGEKLNINFSALQHALQLALTIFPR
ncbi:MAG: hydroxymethylglutaryl-CoA lyase [Bacteroidia bacterium]|nr:hydroxymethylglutaryl-CoA lyase [Bacteroidia bacterium]MDW8157703.1 hydroxymethylglutaryl-CoA lyase [Bacteroidia bacterium]